MEIRIAAREDNLVTLDQWFRAEAIVTAAEDAANAALDPSEWGGEVSGTAETVIAETVVR